MFSPPPKKRPAAFMSPPGGGRSIVFVPSPHRTPLTPSKRRLSLTTDSTLMELEATPSKSRRRTLGLFATGVFRGHIGEDDGPEDAPGSPRRRGSVGPRRSLGFDDEDDDDDDDTANVLPMANSGRASLAGPSRAAAWAPVSRRDSPALPTPLEDSTLTDDLAPTGLPPVPSSPAKSRSGTKGVESRENDADVFDVPCDKAPPAKPGKTKTKKTPTGKPPATKPRKARAKRALQSTSAAVAKLIGAGRRALTDNFVSLKLKSKPGGGAPSGWGRSRLSSYGYGSSALRATGLHVDEDPFAAVEVSECVQLPEKAILTASSDSDRETALLRLLTTTRFRALRAVLVLVLRQKEADHLSSMLGARSVAAAAYHAGCDAKARQLTEQRFRGGKIRVLVATMASAARIEHPQLSGIVQYHMPRSLAAWAAAAGRLTAEDALCHSFISSSDYMRLRSFAFGDSLEPSTVQALLGGLAQVSAADAAATDGGFRSIVLVAAEWEQRLDCSLGHIARLLRAVEQTVSPSLVRQVHLDSRLGGRYRLTLYRSSPGSASAAAAAQLEPEAKRALAVLRQMALENADAPASATSNERLAATTQQLCVRLGVSPENLPGLLNELQFRKQLRCERDGTALAVEVSEVLLDSPANSEPSDAQFSVAGGEAQPLENALDALKALLVARARESERKAVARVDAAYCILAAHAKRSFGQHLRLRESAAAAMLSPSSQRELAEFEEAQGVLERAQEADLRSAVSAAVGGNSAAASGSSAAVAGTSTAVAGNSAAVGENSAAVAGNSTVAGENSAVFAGKMAAVARNSTAVGENSAAVAGKMAADASDPWFSSFADPALVARARSQLESVETDAQSFLASHAAQFHSGRAIARVFHGLASPRYPAVEWARQRYWGAHRDVPFETVARVATRQLFRVRVGGASRGSPTGSSSAS